MSTNNPLVWSPSKHDLTSSSLARFKSIVNEKYDLKLESYNDIHRWSVDPSTAGDFWMELFEFLDLGASEPPRRAFAGVNDMFPSPKFFPGARLNFAGSVLEGRDHSDIALFEATEGSLEARAVTWGELYRHVELLADAMKSHGVSKGDRVAAVIDTSALAIALCLATLSIGAIWTSISPDFGAQGVLDRVSQINPTLIFTDATVRYNGKVRSIVPTVRQWAKVVSATLTSVKQIIVHESRTGLESEFPMAKDLEAFQQGRTGRRLRFEQVPFTHPAFIFYSSGTTGAPKCILHSSGGVLLQVKKDYVLQIDVRPGDILFQYTTTAWIMWAFLVTALSTGAKIVVYRGSPLYPDVGFLPRLLSKLRVSVFGTSAKYLTDLMDSKHKPRDEHDLSALRRVTSTGSILPSDVAQWFYNVGFPPTAQLVSGSGGTDCACSFVTANPLTAVHADEIPGKSLGMAVDVYDSLSALGVSIEDSNDPGELVCTQPFPSQPLTFWGPKGSEKYEEAYFSTFPGIWTQGDLIRVNPETRGIQMLGRSDGVLNPSGVRFGSAEIYNVIRLFSEVEDSICVGQRRPQDRDETVVLFLKLKPTAKRTKALAERIKQRIGTSLSRRHVPKYIFFVDGIPYSNVGKKLEILVKKTINGQKAESTVVANPESLPGYRRFFDIEKAAREDELPEAAKL
ncbi:acetoacetyl-synthase [Plectosphaerella plurivora]|uniref:Acetoacetyl-synthase n=1 Tax=Plectosphaerella plurivora TaxID=936078 RepID=A0A9P9AFT0_9PEZI|nr:acetoacetyl-synthase [Plectosphaerella plurivora]